METNTESLGYKKIIQLSYKISYYSNEYTRALVKMILYVTGNYNFVQDSICLYLYNKDVRREKIGELQHLGTKKPFAEKLNVLLEIFDKYCKIKPHYEDVGHHKAEFVKTNYYYVSGSIPKVIGEVILQTLSKYQSEDEQLYENMKIELQNKTELQNPIAKQLYDELVK